jgi:hypothetical protein
MKPHLAGSRACQRGVEAINCRPTTRSTRRSVRSRRLLAQAARPSAPRVTAGVSRFGEGTRMTRKPLTIVSILQLKVTLRKLSPPVWRRLHIRSDATLEALHRSLQIAFGWGNSHVHSFSTDTATYGPVSLADHIELTDERKVVLRDLFRRPGATLYYEYDPGDGWVHHIVFERVVPLEFERPYPWVVGGRRACPPDDVGGVWGYEHFLDAISDKRHPEHREMHKWYGGAFDPSRFDLAAVNRALHSDDAPAPERLTTRSTRRTPASRGLRGKPRATGRAR